MQNFINKVGKMASSAATTAGNKAEELHKVNKLKSEQSDLKSEYSLVKKKLADYVYKQYEADELKDESLIEFCSKMAELRESIDGLDREIENVKEEYRLKREEDGEDRI